MRIRQRFWVWVVAILAAFSLSLGMSVTAYADAGDPPAHSKSRSDNGDGTYKIELTVTGDSDNNSISDSHVNVLIVYDESSSMSTRDATVGGRNYTRSDVAEDAMYTLMNGLVGYKNQGVDIYAACIGFGTGTNVRSGWTDNLTNVRNLFDAGVDGTVNGSSHGNYGYNGTAWAAALNLASNLLGQNTNQQPGLERINRSQYPTFVILVTDGGPTVSSGNNTTVPGANVPWTSYRVHYNAAAPSARSIQNRANTNLYGIYAFGSDANLLDDLMYYANTGSHRTVNGQSINNAPTGGQNHDFGLDEGADKYYNASNAEALETAISEIFNEIVEAMGITDVSMSDGTTSQVTASTGQVVSLLGVDEDSYQYWMSIPVDANNQWTRTKNVDGSAEEITYTVADNGSGTCTVTWTEGGAAKTVTVDGSVSGGQFKFEWTADSFPNALYEYAPNDAELVNGAVEWDLSNVDVLLDGVTYSVTFDVYPSQTAMDYKARLENGEAYEDVVPEAARDYFHEDGSLETNTEGSITYSDTRLDNPGPRTTDFINPPAVAIKNSSMDVEKSWEGGTPPNITLQMEVIMDGDEENPFEIVDLNSGNSWSAEVNISYGIMRNGEVLEDAPGHDFSFAELGSEQYRWELVAPTVHPMIIDGEETMLVKVDENFPLGDHEPIVIDDEQYYIDEAITSLSATNYRRSNLNITKVVDGDGAPEDATFPFEIVVNNARVASGDTTDIASDAYVWFSVQDASDQIVKDVTVEGATPEDGDTGYFYAESGATITVEIQAGWNIRFINLPSGTTYTVAEGDVSGFKFESVESTGAEDETFEADGKTAEGSIVTYNAQAYEVTFTNEYAQVDVSVDKVWDDASDQDGIRPETLVLTISGGSAASYPNPTITKSADGNTWTYTWAGLDKYDAQGNEITYTVTESNVPDGYTCDEPSATNGGTIINSHEPEEIDITITKSWADGDDQDGIRPDSVDVTLFADGEEVDTVTLDESNQWTYTFLGKAVNAAGEAIEYTVTEVETAVITGTDGPGTYDYEVEGDAEEGFTVTNTHTPEETEVTVTKVWDDANDQDGIRPDSLTVTLSNGDQVTLNEENDWTATISELPKYENGVEIEYTWTEEEIDDYTLSDETTTDGVTTLTNSHTPEEIIIEVTKVWEDNDDQDGIRPDSVTVTVSNGDEVVATLVLNEDNDWTAQTDPLPKNDDGDEIQYVVEETETGIITGTDGEGTYSYEVVNGDDGWTVTNTHTPETTTVTVTKAWDDNDDQDGIRPDSIDVTLMVGDAPADVDDAEATLSDDNDWTYTWENLDKYASGVEIVYTVAEVEVEGYDSETTGTAAEGYLITNIHEPEKTEIPVTKVWEDADNQDGIRPTSVTIALLANGEETGKTVVLNEGNQWTNTFTELDVYAAGDPIEYTIAELEVEGYEVEVAGDAEEGFTVTNTHEPAKTEVTVTKSWQDDENRDGIRPDSVTISLLADGTETGDTVELNEDNQWTATFTGLAVNAVGKPIEYTIAELEVEGYEVTIAGTADEGFTVTNVHESEKTEITVTKVWDDADDRDGIRPESVEVVLLANGDETGDTVTLNEGNGWTATFTDLYVNQDGEPIEYTISELEVEGYEVTIEGDAERGFTITNVHQAEPEPVLSDPPVQKIVQGNPPKDETFTFQMKAVTEGAPMPEGSVDGVKTVTITGSGSYEFGEMVFTEAGTYVYEISEVDDGVKNYTYDTTVYTLTVEVTEVADGNQVKLEKTETVTGGDSATAVFTNVYKGPSPVPKTGDSTPAFGMVALAAIALTGIGAFGSLRRRED